MSSARNNRDATRMLLRLLPMIVLVVPGGGCRRVVGALLEETSHVNGSWKGVVRSVTVTDVNGRQHEAAAFEIYEGPRMPYTVDKIVDEQETGRVALLLRTRDRPHRILAPPDLTVQIGSMARVQGRMQLSFVNVPGSAKRSASGEVTSVNLGGEYSESNSELVIIFRGDPEVLKSF